MKTLTVTEIARNFSSVIDAVERDQEEVILVRNRRTVARLVPEPAVQNVIEVLGDLYRTLDEETAEALARAVQGAQQGKSGTLGELRNPWASLLIPTCGLPWSAAESAPPTFTPSSFHLSNPSSWCLSHILCAVVLLYNPSLTWPSEFSIQLEQSRPLAAALDLLRERHRCVVSYEDPVYGPADIEDVTDRILQEQGRPAAPGLPRVHFPKSRLLELNYEWDGECSQEQLSDVVQRLMEVHHQNRNPGVFRMIRLKDRAVVIPLGIMDEHGMFVPSPSPMDVSVNFEISNGTGDDAIRALLDEINRNTSKRVVGGYIPTNMFYQNRISFEAHNVSAREALVMLIKSMELEVGDGTMLSWRLNYDPNFKQHFLNVRFLGPKLDGPYRMKKPRP
jgi:antitoxin (DNA-binding transcriptional repressor) of toxin-antitoxin stability system